MTIALEPEVASIFCQKLKTDRVEDTTYFTEAVKSGMKYMVIDLGGMTYLSKRRLKIPKGLPEAVNRRRTDHTMAQKTMIYKTL